MELYEWKGNDLKPVDKVTFETEKLPEQALQHALRDAPHVLEEGLFIVAEEYSNWEESWRSIDLLALDAAGRLVVVELKRTLTGNHMDLQAVRYAAMVANMTFAQVVDAHKDYLVGRGEEEDAEKRIREHLGELGDEIASSVPRVLLASGDFSSELTTSVLWLNDNGLEITCVRLDLHRTGDGLYLSSSQVIPVPQASDYQVRLRDKTRERRARATGLKEPAGPDRFRDSIESVPSRRDGWGLRVRLRSGKQPGMLISFGHSGGPPWLWVWRRGFEQYAPESISPVEKLMGHEIGVGNAVKGPITDDLFEALYKAHQEAARRIKAEESDA